MKAALLPSGETLELRGAVEAPGVVSMGVHWYTMTSHFQRRFDAVTVIARMSFEYSTVWKGRRFGSSRVPVTTAFSAVARRAWSNADARERFTGSTMTNVNPFVVEARYQNRPSESQVGRTPDPVTRGAVVVPRNRSARA